MGPVFQKGAFSIADLTSAHLNAPTEAPREEKPPRAGAQRDVISFIFSKRVPFDIKLASHHLVTSQQRRVGKGRAVQGVGGTGRVWAARDGAGPVDGVGGVW